MTFDMHMIDYEKFSHKPVQTDLEKLTSLLDSFLVPYQLEAWPNGGTDLSLHDSLTFVFDKSGEFTSVEAIE